MVGKYFPILLLLAIVENIHSFPELQDANSTSNIEGIRRAHAESVRKYMNESVEPCHDFYQFACGNWGTHHPASAAHIRTQPLETASEKFNTLLDLYLQKMDDMYNESERKVKRYFDSCLITCSQQELRQFSKIRIKEFGQMPVIEGKKWQSTNFDWINIVGEMYHKYGTQVFFGYSTGRGADPTVSMLIMEPKLSLTFMDKSAKGISLKRQNVEMSLKYLLGLTAKAGKAVANEIVDFALKLWNAFEIESNSYEGSTTFAEMHQKYSKRLDLSRLIQTSFGFIPNGSVCDTNPAYIESLATILKKTPSRVIANYIFYSFIIQFNEGVGPYLRGRCMEVTKKHFLPVLSKMVYRRSDLQDYERAIQEMFDGISNTLQHVFESNELSWFDDNSREAALEKLHLMRIYVGSYKDVDFDEQYKDLVVTNDNFLENERSRLAFTANRTRVLLNEKISVRQANIGDFAPRYFRNYNVVAFPVATLVTNHMWAKYRSQAVNHGRLGMTFGHEMMHAFSGGFEQYNGLGFYIQSLYRGLEGLYEERRRCYYDQYHNFTVNGKHLYQDESQAENVADNAGLYLAYHTYLAWLMNEQRTAEELEMETLPDLRYTNKQLFFIAFTQYWCADEYKNMNKEDFEEDTHSPNEFRGFVPLQNFGEFAKEFNCPVGSRMNPVKKCSIY